MSLRVLYSKIPVTERTCSFYACQQAYPEWKDIKMGEIVEDEHYFYRRTSQRGDGKYVLRWPKFYGKDYYKSRYWEKFNARLTKRPRPGQTQLESQPMKMEVSV